MNLRVDDGIMDRLIHAAGRDEIKKEECLKAYWNNGAATWTKVIEAVEKAPINNKRIAKKIANTWIKTRRDEL